MRLFSLLVVALATVPLIEVYVLIAIGRTIGALETILLVVLTAIIGAVLFRWQGLHTLARVREVMARGEIPAIEVVEGVLLLVAGALLLTPGFLTDAVGFACLVPALRRLAARTAVERLFPPTARGRILAGDFTVERPPAVDDSGRDPRERR